MMAHPTLWFARPVPSGRPHLTIPSPPSRKRPIAAPPVLVVDDDRALLETTAAMLEDEFDVRTAASAHAALALLKVDASCIVCADYEVRRAVAEGVFTVLKKPFTFDGAVQSIVRALEHPCVLVVDDEAADAETMAESLSVSGVRAKAVPSGEAAVAEVRAGGVDVCVTDLVMAGMSGAELVRRVREIAPGVTVIVSSGQNLRETVQRMSSAGIFACLQKPVNPAELLQVVAKARGGASAL